MTWVIIVALSLSNLLLAVAFVWQFILTRIAKTMLKTSFSRQEKNTLSEIANSHAWRVLEKLKLPLEGEPPHE